MDRMAEIIVGKVFDGNVHIKTKDVPYSTSVRSIFTIGEMQRYHEKKEREKQIKLIKSSVYGKLV